MALAIVLINNVYPRLISNCYTTPLLVLAVVSNFVVIYLRRRKSITTTIIEPTGNNGGAAIVFGVVLFALGFLWCFISLRFVGASMSGIILSSALPTLSLIACGSVFLGVGVYWKYLR